MQTWMPTLLGKGVSPLARQADEVAWYAGGRTVAADEDVGTPLAAMA